MKPVEKIRSWMTENGYDGIILGRRDNYTWITQGAKNHVVTNGENGVASYVIEQERIFLYADSSDLARMHAEQNTLKGEPILVPWYESMEEALRKQIGNRKFVSDTGIAGTFCVQGALIDMRMQLSEEEVAVYREIGLACASIVEGVCMEAMPGQTEEEIANEVKSRCIKEGISPDCVLVGADERILNYRHPMPTDKKIEKSLMVVLGGEKEGLNISMTRIVYFTPIPEEIKNRYQETARVFASMQLLMKEQPTYEEYFEKVKQLYAEAGYDGEWKMHHQGGPTGYGCREFVMLPEMKKRILKGQAYAWNPTIQGTKCEETTFLSENGIEVFTRTASWPILHAETELGIFEVADILQK